MRLNDIALIRVGLVLSRKQSEGGKHAYRVLTLRSITPVGTIDTDALEHFPSNAPLSDDYLAQEGDVVVRLSQPYTAALIDKAAAGLVVSSNFVSIRVKDDRIVPGYLAWLLNTDAVKRRIRHSASATMLSSINAGFFSSLDIALPLADAQLKIADLHAAAMRECELLRRLADEKERYYAAITKKINDAFIKEITR